MDPPRVTEDTQQAIAEDLGVKQPTVSRAIEESAHIVHLDTLSIPQKSEQKRDAVRSYIDDTPDRVTEDTQQAIAEDLGVDPATVSRAMDECGKELQVQEVNTDEKREQVREPGD